MAPLPVIFLLLFSNLMTLPPLHGNPLKESLLTGKPTRAIYLQNKFSNTKLASFANATAYCQELKHLSDQMANVDAHVSDQTLVLQLIAGLGVEYDNLATILQQMDRLPTFESARSRLIMEEGRKANQSATSRGPSHHRLSSKPYCLYPYGFTYTRSRSPTLQIWISRTGCFQGTGSQ
jgi:hypothetical protein